VTPPNRDKPSLIVILTSLAGAVFFLAYPNYVIRPMRPQGGQELRAALLVLRHQYAAELLCAAVALVALVFYWRSNARRGSRTAAMAGTVIVLLCAALSRINIYEVMFHPAGTPSFQPVRETKLDGGEQVLAVGSGVNSRAYPIRNISYHHVVNDVAGGVPIVVTY
jgi:hypothetical protein